MVQVSNDVDVRSMRAPKRPKNIETNLSNGLEGQEESSGLNISNRLVEFSSGFRSGFIARPWFYGGLLLSGIIATSFGVRYFLNRRS